VRMLAEFFPEFAEKLDKIDEIYASKHTIDEKTYQFICFALSIKGRSKPCVLKHFKGALKAGATVDEPTYILALTMREASGADDCWTHNVIDMETTQHPKLLEELPAIDVVVTMGCNVECPPERQPY